MNFWNLKYIFKILNREYWIGFKILTLTVGYLEVDKLKISIIKSLPYPTIVRGNPLFSCPYKDLQNI